MTGESPEYSVDLVLTKFRFEEVLRAFNQMESIRGELDLKLHLAMKGKNANELKGTAQGDVSLHGRNLFLENLNRHYVRSFAILSGQEVGTDSGHILV
ncbi:MAG TPA: hypothetical protein VI728_02055 [Syntrophales bacterium]|nr:hypothetical protein [Syntrophales bacterium]